MILANANVLTLDPARPRAEAVGLRDGHIVAVGPLERVRAALPGAPERDWGGATVLPGLADAHGHLQMLGERMRQLDLAGAQAPEQVAALVAEVAARLPPGAWVLGKGWDQHRFPGARLPDRSVLDRAAPRHPVFLERIDGHAAWVNGVALERAGALGEVQGGRVLRDERGAPTGILVDRAMELVSARIPAPGPDELDALLEAAARRCASLGLTGVHDAGMTLRAWESLVRLEAAGRLPIRVWAMAWTGEADCGRLVAGGPRARGRLALGAVKIFLDGALGSRGAALFEPYRDERDNRGLLLHGDELPGLVRGWMERGFQVAVHAIGDRATAAALDAFEQALAALGGERRPRLEHAQLLRPGDVARLARLGVVASMQPVHAIADMAWFESALGSARLAGAYAWRSLLDAGARLAFGSDFPIADPDPLAGMEAAVTRRDRAGRPEGGWIPRERVPPLEALRAYTEGPAWASFDERRAGRIAPGFRADLTVLDRDPLAALAGGGLAEARVLATFVGGRLEYAA